MIKFPIDGKWTQLNQGDKFGSLAYTRNCNLDTPGYLKLASRSFSIFSSVDDADFLVPLSFGKLASGSFLVVTQDDHFTTTLSTTALTVAQDAGTSVQAASVNSWGTFWQSRWYVTNQTTTYYKSGSTWTNASIALTTGKKHVLEVFRNKNTMCITDGSSVIQVNTSHASTTNLTIPADFTAIGLAYSNNKMGVATKFAGSGDAYFFVWDGATTEANGGFPVGSDSILAMQAYKNSWVILTRIGQLLYFNGTGFDVLANFPFYEKKIIAGEYMVGENMIVEGDRIYINFTVLPDTDFYGRNQERDTFTSPAGIWCYDPNVGLYHRYSYSNSDINIYAVSAVDTAADTFTIGADIPTGTQVLYSSRTTSSYGAGKNISVGKIYYAINNSATKIKLAETLEDANLGTAIDITVAGTGEYFMIPTMLDYGATNNINDGGAVVSTSESSIVYDHLMFGSKRILTSSDVNNAYYLNVTVPFFKNIGCAILPKVYSENVDEKWSKVYLKHLPLQVGDSIKVSYRTKECPNLPVLAYNNSGTTSTNVRCQWSGSYTVCRSSAGLNDVKVAFDAGYAIDCFLFGGAGAGLTSKLTNITFSAGQYTITIEDDLSGLHFTGFTDICFDHWIVAGTVTSSSETNTLGYSEIPLVDVKGKAIQVKIEMAGNAVTIQELQIIQSPAKLSA